MNQKNLLLILATLIGMKFILAPLLSWQESAVDMLTASSRQLYKVEDVIANEAYYQEKLKLLRARVRVIDGLMYADADDIKLRIQRDIEALFDVDGFKVTGFTWVMDSSGPDSSIRILRATVYFSGSTAAMVGVFWNLSASAKVMKFIDWRQQIKAFGSDLLGGTAGNVTMEFFVSKKAPDEASMELRDIGG